MVYSATDASDNTETCTAAVEISDTTAPTITCPDNELLECTGPAGAAVGLEASAEDICDPNVTITDDTQAVYGLGATTVTFTGTDGSDNQSACSVDVTVQDTTVPAVECAGDAQECTGALTLASPTGSATDVCDETVTLTNTEQPDGYVLGTTDVVYSATDASDNTETCTAAVEITDTTAPTITCPADELLECTGPAGAQVPLSASADDICDPNVTITDDTQDFYGLGATTVTFTGADGSNNESSCSVNVTVQDTTLPAVFCAGDVQECAGALTLAEPFGETTDICDEAPTLTSTEQPDGYALGMTTVVYSATDGSDNTATCEALVEINDTTPPMIACPDNELLECTSPAGAQVALAASAADLCDPDVAITDDTQEYYALGETTVTFTGTDGSLNSASCPVEVVVEDTTPPTVICAGDAQECAGALTLASPTGSATDICDEAPAFTNSEQPDGYALGTTEVVYSATDGSNNTADCMAPVDITDTIAPTVTLNGDNPMVLECAEAYVEPGAVATDICDGDLPVAIAGGVDVSTPGTYTVSYTAEDVSQNSTTVDRAVVVNRFFAADDSIVWHQPIARSGMSDDTDPSNLADGDPSNDVKFRFRKGRTIPVKVHIYDKWGNEVTADDSTSATVVVYSDLACNGVVDAGDVSFDTEYHGVGGDGGLMELVDGHRKYNLSTKNFPDGVDCLILEVVGTTTGACNDARGEYVLLQRK